MPKASQAEREKVKNKAALIKIKLGQKKR